MGNSGSCQKVAVPAKNLAFFQNLDILNIN